MAFRNISIVMQNGTSQRLEMPREKVVVLDLMREIRSIFHLSKKQQMILFQGQILKAFDEIPDLDDLELTLISVRPYCAFCFEKPTHPQALLYCSRCRHATYCGHTCQRLDWQRHRKLCQPVISTSVPSNER